MKKVVSVFLILCLIFCAVPAQVWAYVGDIRPGESVQQRTLSSGSLALQNDYLCVIVRKDGTLSTAPTADSANPKDRQTPYCEFISYTYGGNGTVHPAKLQLKSVKFVNETPNGKTKAIAVEYAMTVDMTPQLTITADTTVYHEIVQLKDSGAAEDDWGVLTSVDDIHINLSSSDEFYEKMNRDVGAMWGYTLDGFTGMGHPNATESPVIKMNRVVYNTDQQEEVSNQNSVITSKIEDLITWESFSMGRDFCYDRITEVYVDGYTWANPFVGLSDHYKENTINAYLPDTVSVTPGGTPASTRVVCENDIGFYFGNDAPYEHHQRFLWGFRDLVAGKEEIPTKADKVDPSIFAKRLAAFADGNGGVTVEYVADDAALEALKKQYNASPVAIINGDYKSTNGASFEFTGGAALLSSTVTATWGSGGKLIIHRDGTVEQSGVLLSAPTFKFYQPVSGKENELKISLTNQGFAFEIEPGNNAAVVYIDIPYATVKLESATADAKGNLVFDGEISFRTVFEGAEFEMEKLGYGLVEKTVAGKKTYEFKVNGVKATGSFNTADLMSLELAEVEGEVNTFKGEERYAFSLNLNAFDLFETEAELALERANDGSLIPDALWFYVKASPGIILVPPIPIGQLNGGGAGFKDLAATVNGNYFAIPPLKLRGALTGTYLHLIEGTGNVVIGPSEISLKATDVGFVGAGDATKIVESFGYSLKLNGQERTYLGETYQGIYFAGSEELKVTLPSKAVDVIILDTSIELGAFGGANAAKDRIYLGIGANGVVKGTLQIPSDVPLVGGLNLGNMDVNLIVGGQTTAPIKDVTVNDALKEAFRNIDVYLGAMVRVNIKLVDVRAWVLVPQIMQSNFRRGVGWDVEHRWCKSLPEWDWSNKGVSTVVHELPLEDGGENAPVLYSAEPLALEGGGNTETIVVNSTSPDETPYILLAFDKSVTEEEIKNVLAVSKNGNSMDINWVIGNVESNPNAEIIAGTDVIQNTEDKKEYRVVMLRLKEGGTYEVNTGSLNLEKHKEVKVTPFESLNLNLANNQVSGQIQYAEAETKYVLRTYLADAEGGADYLIEEQEVADPAQIAAAIPTEGALAPTGDYYVTAFLMTEKEVTLEDGTTETGLVAIDSQPLGTVHYVNRNQPAAPGSVTLEATGNEVMKASWDKVDGADGYAVTIYQQNEKREWVDTGYGYDLDANTTSIDMALTVGGEETEESKNLSAGKTYKVGVRAYKTVEGGKYYSQEVSAEEYLPKYVPLAMELMVNETRCVRDAESKVYLANVGEGPNTLTISSPSSATFSVTRMDTNEAISPEAEGGNTFELPEFTGSLMFRVDGISGKDVTSVFLLVSLDTTAPVLALSAPVFYADDTGAYTITGTAEAGSQIFYDEDKSVYAENDGSFRISGKLDEGKTSISVNLYAQDAAQNLSDAQMALVTRRMANTVTVQGSYAQSSGAGEYAANETVTIHAGTRSGYRFAGWTSDAGVTFADANAADTSFRMPDRDVTVTANWTEESGGNTGGNTGGGTGGSRSYPVNVPADIAHGRVTVSPKNAASGGTVTITVEPEDGYTLEQLGVKDQNGNDLKLTDRGNGKYTFTMPAGRVDVTASFMEDNAMLNFFVDVPAGSYYYDAVLWAAKNGITGGTDAVHFSPGRACTRGQIVTFLWRAVGQPKTDGAVSFTDVKAGAYCAEAIRWAETLGIVTGYGNGRFGMDDAITREQMVVLLYRFAKAQGMDTTQGGMAIREYADFDEISEYALEAMAWAVNTGIIQGTDGRLMPKNTCTRAQVVTMLYRLLVTGV